MPKLHRFEFARTVGAACILTAGGGSMDAWVYLDHGHVFANAQTGNVVLFSILVATGRYADAMRHVPPMAAFCAGLIASRLAGAWLKRRGANSRNLRLSFEALGLVALGHVAPHLPDAAVTTAIGFIAAVQITTLSHIGAWSFNTGMTTGNLRGAFSAATAAWLAPADVAKRFQAIALGLLCASFLAGALAGGTATVRWGDPALLGTATMIVVGAIIVWRVPDPIPPVVRSD